MPSRFLSSYHVTFPSSPLGFCCRRYSQLGSGGRVCDALTDLGSFILDGASPGLVVQPQAGGPGVGPTTCYNFRQIPLFLILFIPISSSIKFWQGIPLSLKDKSQDLYEKMYGLVQRYQQIVRAAQVSLLVFCGPSSSQPSLIITQRSSLMIQSRQRKMNTPQKRNRKRVCS